jgi:cbb3-type cytochrome oxidase maturation protein
MTMEILYLLIPLSLVLVVMIIGVFWIALRGGQFDDLEGPAWRILMDEEETEPAPVTARPASSDPVRKPPKV